MIEFYDLCMISSMSDMQVAELMPLPELSHSFGICRFCLGRW